MSGNNSHKFLDCSLFPDEIWKCDSLFGLRIFTSSLSLISTTIILFLIIVLKKYKNFSQRLILQLILSGFVNSIFYLANRSDPNHATCNFLGFTLSYVSWVISLWILVVTVNILLNVLSMNSSSIGLGNREKYEKYFVGFCWIFPIIPSALPFVQNNTYGPAGPWCWIISDSWRFGVWFIPWILMLIVLVVIYSYSIFVIVRRVNTWDGFSDNTVNSEMKRSFVRDNIKSLIGFPLVFILASIFSLINRCNDAAHRGQPNYALYVLMTLTSPLKGAGYAIAFALNPLNKHDISWTKIKLAVTNWNTPTTGFSDYQVSDQGGATTSGSALSSNTRVATISLDQRPRSNGTGPSGDNDEEDEGVWTEA